MIQTNGKNTQAFFIHLIRNMFIGIIFIMIAMMIGMMGYHSFEHMSWVDAFVNAAMILSGMGPLSPLTTTGGKIFAGCYALFSGLAFIVLISVMFAPFIHRFFKKIHLENSRELKE